MTRQRQAYDQTPHMMMLDTAGPVAARMGLTLTNGGKHENPRWTIRDANTGELVAYYWPLLRRFQLVAFGCQLKASMAANRRLGAREAQGVLVSGWRSALGRASLERFQMPLRGGK